MSQGFSTINLDLRYASFVMLLPFQLFPHHLGIHRRDVQQDSVPAKLPRHDASRAGASERVEHQVPRAAASLDAQAWQF